MTIGNIEFISPEFIPEGPTRLNTEISSGKFADWLSREMNAVNTQILRAEDQVQQLVTGGTDNIHQVMLSLEKAKLEFEMVLQVRNRLLEGYQEIMRMQV